MWEMSLISRFSRRLRGSSRLIMTAKVADMIPLPTTTTSGVSDHSRIDIVPPIFILEQVLYFHNSLSSFSRVPKPKKSPTRFNDPNPERLARAGCDVGRGTPFVCGRGTVLAPAELVSVEPRIHHYRKDDGRRKSG